MKKNNSSRSIKSGFTLIELLVVVAIIGILASVVLASLKTARDKAADAVIKGTMANVRAQAQLWYENQGGVWTSSLCTPGSNLGIYSMVQSAAHKLDPTAVAGHISTDVYAYSSSGASDVPDNTYASVCHANSGGWAAITSLKNPTLSGTGGWCVDWTGASKESPSLDVDDVACP